MNENQHDANVAMSHARANFAIKRQEMAKARQELRIAIGRLQTAIKADPASWHGTPNIEKTDKQLADDAEEVND